MNVTLKAANSSQALAGRILFQYQTLTNLSCAREKAYLDWLDSCVVLDCLFAACLSRIIVVRRWSINETVFRRNIRQLQRVSILIAHTLRRGGADTIPRILEIFQNYSPDRISPESMMRMLNAQNILTGLWDVLPNT